MKEPKESKQQYLEYVFSHPNRYPTPDELWDYQSMLRMLEFALEDEAGDEFMTYLALAEVLLTIHEKHSPEFNWIFTIKDPNGTGMKKLIEKFKTAEVAAINQFKLVFDYEMSGKYKERSDN